MIPYKQLFKHDPENGTYGDCHRTAIGSVFNIPPGQMPHFYDQDRSEAEAQHLLGEWLATRGLTQISLPFPVATPWAADDIREILSHIKRWNGGQYYLLSGSSRPGIGHTVVCLDDMILSDPSPTEAGINGPLEGGYYLVTFFGSSLASSKVVASPKVLPRGKFQEGISAKP